MRNLQPASSPFNPVQSKKVEYAMLFSYSLTNGCLYGLVLKVLGKSIQPLQGLPNS